MKIRARLLIGFLLVIVIGAATGIYSVLVIRQTSARTAELYDRPLMASSFALAAAADFERADRELMAAALADAGSGLKERDKAISELEQSVISDLKVVEQRFTGDAGARLIRDANDALHDWHDLFKRMVASDPAELPVMVDIQAALRDAMVEKLDILVEGAKEEGLEFRNDAVAVGRFSFWLVMGAVAMTVVVGISLALLIARGLGRPIMAIARTMAQITDGDTEIAIPATGRHDEVGQIARAAEVLKQSMINAARLAAEQREEQEQKLRRQAVVENHILVFEDAVRASVDMLTSAASEMQATSRGMSTDAQATRTQAATVSQAAEQASLNVQTVASATEELSASVNEIGRQVSDSTRIAARAVSEADRTNATVQGLSAAAQKIGDVVRLISDIASQTNLLALNATIEAARAGDAGKGFAVVASEVKSLANQTANATQEIAAQVAAMQAATMEAVQAIDGIGRTIQSVNDIAAGIAASVEEQGAATQEIARNVVQAAQGTGQVSNIIGDVNHAIAKTGEVADQVLASASRLNGQAESLHTDIDVFLAKIRAA